MKPPMNVTAPMAMKIQLTIVIVRGRRWFIGPCAGGLAPVGDIAGLFSRWGASEKEGRWNLLSLTPRFQRGVEDRSTAGNRFQRFLVAVDLLESLRGLGVLEVWCASEWMAA